jgi:bifunctional enzyme CysN/CysC
VSLEGWNVAAPAIAAGAGQSVGVTLDEQIFVERGEVASHVDHAPIETNVFRARLFWLGKNPLRVGNRYMLKVATARHLVEVQKIEKVVDTTDLSSGESETVARNAVAEVVLRSRSMLALDEFRGSPRTGRFVLIEDYDIVGGGIISMEGYADQRAAHTVKSTNIFSVEHRVTTPARWRANGHKSGVIWLTGLSGAGKTTLSLELERQLFLKGYQVYVIDGDNVRHGLSADLAFSPEDRAENIRRVGEVAALFADAGFVVVTAFISPYRSDRDRARAIRPDMFHEIYIKADLETCEQRDPKGLYKKARSGEIEVFTGITAPYEPPERPDLVVDTSRQDVAASVGSLLDYVEQNFGGADLEAIGTNGASARRATSF